MKEAPSHIAANDSKTPSDSKASADSLPEPVAQAATGRPLPKPEIRDHELISPVGRGSYGEVWLARNVMGTFRAVKIVYRAAFEHTRPFEREFNGIKKFEPLSRSHDGLIDILQVGSTEDYFYYVMELADDQVTGQQINSEHYAPRSLRSEMHARRPLAFEKCVELGISLTQALGHLHQHGLIHRDIKPSNIIFVNGILKLADIGLVAEQSEAKSFVGTEGFIPPEGPGTPQADIYSLGKVIYEIATGKDRHEFPVLPTALGDEEPDTQLLELNTVFLKACQGDVRLRYQTAEQMRDDLLLLQSGKSVKRAQAAERRATLLTRIGLVGALATLCISAAFLYVNHLRIRAASAERKVKEQLYVSDMILAERALREGNIGRVEQILDDHLPGNGAPDPRGFEYFYLKYQCRGDHAFIFGPTESPAYAVAFSPDGKFLAAGTSYAPERKDYSGQLQVFDLTTRKEVFGIPHTDGTRSLAFSRDGKSLLVGNAGSVVSVLDWEGKTNKPQDFFFAGAGATAKLALSPAADLIAALFYGPTYATPGRIFLRNTVTGKDKILNLVGEDWQSAQAVHGTFLHEPGSISFSPDGKKLAFVEKVNDFHSVVRFWERSSTHVVEERSPPWEGTIQALEFAPDGTYLALGGANGILSTWKLGQGQFRKLGQHQHAILSLDFSRDGQHMVSGCADGTIKLWDLTAQREERLVRGHRDRVNDVKYSPDGSQVASASQDRTVRLWPVEFRETGILRPATQAVRTLAFSKDNSLLATGSQDGSVSLWDVTTGVLRHSFTGLTNGVISIAISPRGSLLAAGTTDRLVKIWETQSGREIATLTTGREEVASLDFSPDATFLALGGWDFITIWDCKAERIVIKLPGHVGESRVSFSQDGRFLVTAGAGFPPVRIWEVGSWNLAKILITDLSPVKSLALAPDGHTLITGSEDSSVKLWDITTGRCLDTLKGAVGGVWALSISPDGKTLAVGDASGAIKLWNLVARSELFALIGHQQSVSSLAFSPDGTTLASASADGTVRLWQATRANSARPGS